jgi:hypothetical protein
MLVNELPGEPIDVTVAVSVLKEVNATTQSSATVVVTDADVIV